MKQKKQIFVSIVLISILLICHNLVIGQDSLVITHGPYLLEPGENSITVVWFTSKKCVSWVEYGTGENLQSFPTYGSVIQTAVSSRHGLIDAYTNAHKIRIDGLESGQKYRYRLFSKEIVQFKPYEVTFGGSIASGVYQFETLDTKKAVFSFGVVTDIHGRSARLDTLLQTFSWDGIDMMFYAGDCLDWFEDEKQIFEGFLDVSVDRFAKEIPLIYVRGNHETRGNFARNLMDYFPHSSGRFYYSFDQGPVHFIILDSGEDKPDSHAVYAGLVDFDRYRDEQAAWLKEDIQSESFKKALYKVVFSHMPPDEDSRGYGEQYLGKVWTPILNEADIDLLLCGHKHRFSRIEPIEGKNKYPILILGRDMIIKADVSQERISGVVTRRNGDVLDRFSILPKNK